MQIISSTPRMFIRRNSRRIKCVMLLGVIVVMVGLHSTFYTSAKENGINAHTPASKSDVKPRDASTFDVTSFLNKLFKPGACVKKTNVSFLKVHKTGSTTVMNIFIRFAINNKLNIMLPVRTTGYGFNYIGYKKTIHKENIVPLPDNETYNIMCNHVVYNKTVFKSFMPEDTAYVSILRDPVDHFISAAKYYGLFDHLKGWYAVNDVNIAIRGFLRNPEVHLSFLPKMVPLFLHNGMSFDFGIPESRFEDSSYIDAYLEELSGDFDLVMLLERYQESLVLLKRTLCWETEDILYVPLNAMPQTGSYPINLKPDDISRLRQYNSVDFQLYGRFKEIFEKKVRLLGQNFQEEVISFTKIQTSVEEYCRRVSGKDVPEKVRDSTPPLLTISATKWGAGFNVTKAECDIMMEDELSLVRRLTTDAWQTYKDFIINLST